MKALEKKIMEEAVVLPGHVLKCGSFLNQQIDVQLLREMAKEIKRLYSDSVVTKILTIEASGIAIAAAVGLEFDANLVFAKKSHTDNMSGDSYVAKVHSYTHGTDHNILVTKDYLTKEDKVLIVDDFLANGEALRGLISLCKQAGCEIVGCAIGVEKGFQPGGRTLREEGYRVESMAIIESMDDTSVVFRQQ